MSKSLQLKRFVWIWLLAFWTSAAYAAQATFVGDLSDIPPAAIAISVLLSIIGGSAWTATKLSATDVVVKSVPLEVMKDILTSIVVGLVIFCFGSYLHWPAVLQAGFITLGGYGGSRVLDPLLNLLLRRLDRIAGDGSPPGPGGTPP